KEAKKMGSYIYDATGATKEAFAVDFGNIQVERWTMMDNLAVATFSENGQTKYAYYDYNDELVATTTDMAFSDLPLKAQKIITKKYGDYDVSQVMFYDDNEFNETDFVIYGEPFQDEDSYFVELSKGAEKIVLHVYLNGDVSYFKKLSS
ncbi:MAG TPA: hypothetical protein VFV08_11935, partial [Puia sp.]|nr:hypothetical protein [Puia sp.]